MDGLCNDQAYIWDDTVKGKRQDVRSVSAQMLTLSLHVNLMFDQCFGVMFVLCLLVSCRAFSFALRCVLSHSWF